MKWTSQIWMSSFIEFEMDSDNQPTELEIIQAYEKLQEIDNPQVEYTETIDQTESHSQREDLYFGDDGTLDTVVCYKDQEFRYDSEYRFSFDNDKQFLEEIKEEIVENPGLGTPIRSSEETLKEEDK